MPFWSARLAWVPDAHLFSLGDKSHAGPAHGGMAENKKVLNIAYGLAKNEIPEFSEDDGPSEPVPEPNLQDLERLLSDAMQNRNETRLSNLPPHIQRAVLQMVRNLDQWRTSPPDIDHPSFRL